MPRTGVGYGYLPHLARRELVPLRAPRVLQLPALSPERLQLAPVVPNALGRRDLPPQPHPLLRLLAHLRCGGMGRGEVRVEGCPHLQDANM